MGKASSTITTILKKKENIKGLMWPKGVTLFASKKKWPEILNEVEKLLLVWVNEKQLPGDSISDILICEKARALYDDLLHRTPVCSADEEGSFQTSQGWFHKE